MAKINKQAEQEARRDKGNVTAAVEDDDTEKVSAGGDDDADAKIAEAAEEHRARLLAGDRPPRRTL